MTNTTTITPHTTTTQEYPVMAFSSAITEPSLRHYERMKELGINTVSICIHTSHVPNYYKAACMHTVYAKKAEMNAHAFMLTDLTSPVDDISLFTKRFYQLGFTSGSKMTIWVNSNHYVKNREERIIQMMDLLAKYHPRENIDVAFYKRDLDSKLYDLSKLPKLINLTVINCNAQNSGVPEAGTWVYTDEMGNTLQGLAYDFYGFYTDDSGYQLSLVDTDYVVQKGDTWHSISRRHGIPLVDLLMLNRATIFDQVFAGQVVRIA